mgnify:CR=1 FL=1
MSKDKLTDYDSTTPSNNTDIGGISVAEGMLPSAVNNSIRELTKQLGAFADGTDGIDVLSLADDDASHAIKLQAPSAVTADTTFTLPDGDGASGQAMITDGAGTLSWAAPYGNRNLIINGAMNISQRNGASSSTLTSSQVYYLDRFFAVEDTDGTMTIQQSSTSPTDFQYSALLTTGTADTSLAATQICYVGQKLEGLNVAHLNWGTANAKTLTLSFYVRSSLTGTFGGAFANAAFNRSYPFTYSISSADTWEYKTITVAGDTTGTWPTDNTASIQVFWGLGVGSTYSGTAGAWVGSGNISATGATNVIGTASATFYLTGVQLELGDTATPFEHRSFGDELARCQRYYWENGGLDYTMHGAGMNLNTTTSDIALHLPVTMRSSPTVTSNALGIQSGATTYAVSSISNIKANTNVLYLRATVSGVTAGYGAVLVNNNNASGYLRYDAEL